MMLWLCFVMQISHLYTCARGENLAFKEEKGFFILVFVQTHDILIIFALATLNLFYTLYIICQVISQESPFF